MAAGTFFDEMDPYPDNIVHFRRMDDVLYRFLMDKDASRKKAITEGAAVHEPFPLLAEDIFMSLYKSQLQVKDSDEMASNLKINHQLLKQLMNQDGFDNLRKRSRSNWINSLVISSLLGNRVLDMLKQLQEQEGDGDDPGKGNASPDVNQPGPAAVINDKEVDQHLEGAVGKANQALEGLDTWLDAFGREPGDPQGKMNYQDVRQVYDRLLQFEDDLHGLMRELGRMRVIAGKVHRRKPPQSQYGIRGIETGSQLEDVIPSDLMAAVDPNLEDAFWQKYQEQNLLTYDRTADDPEGEGPVVICIDCSGSMDGPRIMWSKAVALAALEQIHRKRRDGEVVLFDSAVQKMIMIPGTRKLNQGDLLEVASFFSGGGTEFMPPLQKAKEVIDSDQSFTRADILFITDGSADVEAWFLDDFNQWKEGSHVHLITCLIGNLSPKVVEGFSNRITALDANRIMDTEGAQTAESIFVDLLSH